MTEATKQCPFCAETIQAAAIVCRYCGRDLTPAPFELPRVVSNGAGGYTCSVCGGGVRRDATSCKSCQVVFGVPLADKPVRPAPAAAVPAPKAKTPVWVWFLIGGVLVAMWAYGSLHPSKPSAPAAPAAPAAPDAFGAFVICEQFVKDRLKAPATAVFPASFDTQTEKLSAVQFRNHAYVDSQNGFGANIRTQYTCTVTSTGGDNWHLDNLTTNP